ncbi:lipocalin-like domain-containing protein [Ideonella sp. BN130291]|uniref:lipocalin-like domain-containing protein n=1 Tax=Ideonella sp. BN130291 TaxID=3112940 RepID=UPI002E272B4E|nr:carotenoid 1,2-hydratase [Ideonella sp. BN130291]
MKRRHWLLYALAARPLCTAAAVDDAQGVTRRALAFPRDHGAHPETRTEWWYVTGRLQAERSADVFGFQVTFFRSRTDVPADHPSRFAARQLLFAHAALSDLPLRRLRHDQRIAREGFGIAQAAREDTGLVLRDWKLSRQAAGRYRAEVASDSAGFALRLDLTPTQPLLLQGDAGYSRKGPLETQASHYYSQPQLQVAGELRRDGRTQAVAGTAWLDHEWSDTLMPPDAVGWDWIGMNLDDGGALTAFRLRRPEGSGLWSGGSLRRPGAAAQAFEGPQAVRFTPLRHWTSPASGVTYPVQWRVESPAGSHEVRALLDAQELDSRASTGSIYWEGLSELVDANTGRRLGQGYLEMTGYAGALRL